MYIYCLKYLLAIYWFNIFVLQFTFELFSFFTLLNVAKKSPIGRQVGNCGLYNYGL